MDGGCQNGGVGPSTGLGPPVKSRPSTFDELHNPLGPEKELPGLPPAAWPRTVERSCDLRALILECIELVTCEGDDSDFGLEGVTELGGFDGNGEGVVAAVVIVMAEVAA